MRPRVLATAATIGATCKVRAYAPTWNPNTHSIEGQGDLVCDPGALRVVTILIEKRVGTGANVTWSKPAPEGRDTLTSYPNVFNTFVDAMSCTGITGFHTYPTRVTGYYYDTHVTAWSPGSSINCG